MGGLPIPLGGEVASPASSPRHATRVVLVWALRSQSRVLTILIADDEPHVTELVRLTLEDERIHVIVALDGETALAQAWAFHPELIFLDVQLPDISGFDVCARLRTDARFAETTIVMLTAAAQEADVVRGLAAGANHYMTKPFSPVRLLSLVESVAPQAIEWPRA